MEIDKKFIEAVLEERTRLLNNSYPNPKLGLGKNFIIKCNNNAREVMDLSRKVLIIINEKYSEYSKINWNDFGNWKKILPIDFINGFSRKNKFNLWNVLFSETMKHEKWKFEDWIFLMDPADRMWFWWGATLIADLDNDYFIFSAKVLDDPFLSGTLKWLFLASGALDVIDEDDL